MSRFLDRYLPRSERRTALWLVFGGAAVQWIALELGQQVTIRATVEAIGPGTPPGGVIAVAGLAQFAVVALLVAAFIRFARAPRALGLYMLASAAVSVVTSLGRPVIALVPYLGVALGAVAGAWIASTVSLARIRDAGFSGDSPDGKGLSTEHRLRGWAFLGWDGRPLEGDPLLALTFAGASAIAGIVLGVALRVVTSALGGLDPGTSAVAMGAVLPVVATVTWLVVARAVTSRLGVRSVWLVPLSGGLTAIAYAAWSMVAVGDLSPAQSLLGSGTLLLVPLPSVAAALLGTHLAIRREPATLSASDPQDPGTDSASDDTAGGTDG